MSLLALLGKILFVGPSLLGPDLPRLVEAGLVAMEAPAEVEVAKAPAPETDVQAVVLADGTVLAAWAEAAPGAELFVVDGPIDGARAIPMAQALAALEREVAAGKVPGIDSMAALVAADGRPTGKGDYFAAMVHLAALTGRSPEGVPAKLLRLWPSREAVIDEAQAAAFQRVAAGAVRAAEAEAAEASAEPEPEPAAEVPTEAGGEEAADEAAPVTEPAASDESTEATAPADAEGPEPASEPASDEPSPETAAADPVAAEAPDPAPPPAVLTPITNPNLSLGLAGVNDWSVQQPFLDVFKTARPWVGHRPGQWGGMDEAALRAAGALDAEGWPLRIPPEVTALATLVLTDLPPEAGGVAGRYVLTHEGRGTLRLEGRAAVAAVAPGRILFDFTPGEGGVVITIAATDAADPIRHIRVVREDRAALLASGEVFNPDWLARIEGVRGLRFMDWMATNDSPLSRAADRPLPTDYTWARAGVPLEVIVALANRLKAEPWINIPHMAEDALVQEIAEVVKRDLYPGLRVWVEYSNEVWNWQFGQAAWAEEQAQVRWGGEYGWLEFYGLRAAEVMAIWKGAMGPDRLVRVVGTQTGVKGIEAQILLAPRVVAEGLPPPVDSFDAYAVTGYVSGLLGGEGKVPAVRGWLAESLAAAEAGAAAQGLTGAAAADYVAAHRYDLADAKAAGEIRSGRETGQAEDTLDRLLNDLLPYHAAVAALHDLRLVMYEGGTHVVGYGPQVEDAELTAFFTHLNYTPQMGALYADLLAGWAKLSDAPFNAFVDVYAPGKWGSWGALRHLGDDNPRWQALATGCGGC